MLFLLSRRLAVPLLFLPTTLLAQQAAPPPPDAAAPAAPSSETPVTTPATAPAPPPAVPALETIEVVARRLNEARTGIETQVGASVYTIDSAAIAAMPAGDNSLLNQVIMQAPEVAQDSFGQFHVRGEHNGLQYRLNGIILPEGISVFGQSLDPRLISSMQLITGALPAEYGLRTAGIIDLTTKSGALDPGGSVSIYAGSHGTVEPSINYGANAGPYHYFFSGDALTNRLGIESPDGSATPLHDRSKQYHGFGYFEDVLDSSNRLSLILSASSGAFQIPDLRNAQPGLGLVVNGQTSYPSAALNENQREQTQFGIVSWQHSAGAFDLQTSVTARQSTLQFTPDPLGDLLYNGISQSADKKNVAYDWQTDSAYQLSDAHTVRAGLFVQKDTSSSQTSSQVLPLYAGGPLGGTQQGDAPETITDNGSKSENIESLYVQDEWRWTPGFTVNYGLRFDTFSAYTSATQLSPRLNVVWKATPRTTVHAGYARYLSPPPFELVGTETIAKFDNTTAAPQLGLASTPQAERANYTDIGVLQTVNQKLSLGVDSYFKLSSNLIDEGQFGAPIILTPFNYAAGRQYGVEATANYTSEALSVYGNLAWQTAVGRDINTAQFNFSAADLAYIADNYIHLDHEQKVTASGGASYNWGDNRVSTDFLLGSGLRADLLLPDGSHIPNGARLPYYAQVNAGASHVFHLTGAGTLTARFDIINLFDREYEIRNGTGVGVGAPQFGPRRGYFVGLSKSI
jgi:outer membrane receptor protein involved in Fe transport